MDFRFRGKNGHAADITRMAEFVESPGGISPPGAPKTVRARPRDRLRRHRGTAARRAVRQYRFLLGRSCRLAGRIGGALPRSGFLSVAPVRGGGRLDEL